jgi:DivIVA domain-containing protein
MLTPDEIRVKEFLPSLRGYDADEVRSFLHAIADSLDQQAATPEPPALPAPDPRDELASKVMRLSEELELALWVMRRLESTVVRLEERLDRQGGSSSLAS